MQVTNATKEKMCELETTLQNVSKSIETLVDNEQKRHAELRNSAGKDHATSVRLHQLQNDIHILRNAKEDVNVAIEYLSELLTRSA